MSRIDDLKRAEEKLSALVSAAVRVCNDETACEMLREAAGIHGVAIISADDLEHRAVLALAKAKAGQDVERARAAKAGA